MSDIRVSNNAPLVISQQTDQQPQQGSQTVNPTSAGMASIADSIESFQPSMEMFGAPLFNDFSIGLDPGSTNTVLSPNSHVDPQNDEQQKLNDELHQKEKEVQEMEEQVQQNQGGGGGLGGFVGSLFGNDPGSVSDAPVTKLSFDPSKLPGSD